MFNRGRFNNGKFNTMVGASQSSSAFMSAVMDGRASATLKLKSSAKGDMEMTGKAFAIKHINAGTVRVMESELVANKVNSTKIYKCSARGDMEMTAFVTGASTYGLAYLKLVGINLAPGQELVIDTDALTVEVNGQNKIMFLTNDSDIENFLLKPGANDITYTDNAAARTINAKVLWKDRWL